jgi:hypothetical protein
VPPCFLLAPSRSHSNMAVPGRLFGPCRLVGLFPIGVRACRSHRAPVDSLVRVIGWEAPRQPPANENARAGLLRPFTGTAAAVGIPPPPSRCQPRHGKQGAGFQMISDRQENLFLQQIRSVSDHFLERNARALSLVRILLAETRFQ